jgi:hypothetical protein
VLPWFIRKQKPDKRRTEEREKMLLAKGSLDLVLVPCGMVIMFGYHLILLYRILRRPGTTVIGYENHNKLAWVRRMTQVTTQLPNISLGNKHKLLLL